MADKTIIVSVCHPCGTGWYDPTSRDRACSPGFGLICMKCGDIFFYNEDKSLRRATPEEILEQQADPQFKGIMELCNKFRKIYFPEH